MAHEIAAALAHACSSQAITNCQRPSQPPHVLLALLQDGWKQLASHYHTAADLLLDEAAVKLTAAEWTANPGLRARFAQYRRCGYWCAAIGLQYTAAEKDEDFLLELTGRR